MHNVVEAPATMSSTELLEIVNQARLEFGESKIRNNVFAERIKDELDGDAYKTFVSVPEGGGTPMETFELTRDQCMLVAMRESKGVRRKVLAKLKEAEQAQVKPPVSPSLADPATTLLAIGKGLLDMVPGINPAIMAAKTLTAITDNTGLDTSALRLALPASETPTEALLNATQLGKLLGISAQKVNKRLTEAGLQYRDDKGNWLLTPEGTKHAEALPFERHGHAGYQVMWRSTVVGLIETQH